MRWSTKYSRARSPDDAPTRLALLAVVALLGLSAAPPAPAQSAYVVTDITVGCRDRDQLEALNRIIASGDREAYVKASMGAVLNGRCAVLEKGQTVYVEDTAIFAGLSKVRPHGDTVTYWMPVSNIRR